MIATNVREALLSNDGHRTILKHQVIRRVRKKIDRVAQVHFPPEQASSGDNQRLKDHHCPRRTMDEMHARMLDAAPKWRGRTGLAMTVTPTG